MEIFWYEELGILRKLLWRVGKGQTHSRKLGSMFSIVFVNLF